MIVSLGQGVPYSYRMPFTRPAQAGNYTPQLAPTGFFSHITPFQHTMLPLASFRPNLPNMPRMMQPGVVAADGAPPPNASVPAPRIDAGADLPPEQIRGAFGFSPQFVSSGRPAMALGRGFGRFGANGPSPGSQVVASMGPSVPQPQAQAAAMPAAAGAARRPVYGSRNAFPARTIREGMWPQVRSTAAGIRSGVVASSAMINNLMPQSFTARNRQIESVYNGNRAY